MQKLIIKNKLNMNIMLKKVAVLCASALVAFNFYSCNKNDVQTNQVNEEGLKTVPFFEVAKGDSIAKGILREKPKFDDDMEVLFTSESIGNQLKATETSERYVSLWNAQKSWPIKYICDLKTHVSRKNNAPATITIDGHTYYKIPVDLNEGAGGKWIYLYYRYIDGTGNPAHVRDGLISIDAKSQGAPILDADGLFERAGKEANGHWADLNDGAGGKYVKLQALHWHSYVNYTGNIITDIAITSSSNSSTYYYGETGNIGTWHRVNVDLNDGAGGKYIYLHYATIPAAM
jgi:hypothetical protein